MNALPSNELRQRILHYLDTVTKAKNRDIARATGEAKDLVDRAIGDLAREDKIEYRSFGGVTYVALKDK